MFRVQNTNPPSVSQLSITVWKLAKAYKRSEGVCASQQLVCHEVHRLRETYEHPAGEVDVDTIIELVNDAVLAIYKHPPNRMTLLEEDNDDANKELRLYIDIPESESAAGPTPILDNESLAAALVKQYNTYYPSLTSIVLLLTRDKQCIEIARDAHIDFKKAHGEFLAIDWPGREELEEPILGALARGPSWSWLEDADFEIKNEPQSDNE